MRTLDLKKQWKHLYSPSAGQVQAVDVPNLRFLMVHGRVEPREAPGTSREFQEAIGALYGVSYTLKFMSKLRPVEPVDYPVMPLEGLWTTAVGEFDPARPEGWEWTLMILQPEHLTLEMLAEALDRVRRKGGAPALSCLRLDRFHEGLCLQVMHVGPYSEEPQTIARLRAAALEKGCALRDRHHEIYLGDPRRCRPERLKTILRHPVAPAEEQ